VTVAGKGGRPRKWTSQADRQRAWRARQTGAAEPATFIEALNNGDELAAAVAHADDLAHQLEAAKEQARRLQVELTRERRERATEDRRWGWITTANEQLTADNHRLRSELDEALDKTRNLSIELNTTRRQLAAAAAAPPPEPPAPPPATLPRAQRRRLEREQRRRT
jgi:chromosome segregation ATPase